VNEGCDVDQEGRENHGSHGVEKDLRGLILRDEAESSVLPLDLAHTESDSRDSDGITPAENVKEPVLLGEPGRVPDSVEVEVNNQC